MPEVSIVLPNYNHARFLNERLESIRTQTFPDWELIYLDDASTDDSDAVFAAWVDGPANGDTRVHPPQKNETNGGSPFAQWNRGVARATGEFVWIAEADDTADPTLLDRLVSVLKAHPNVGVAYCQSLLIDAEGRVTGSAREYNRNLGADVARRWEADFVTDGRDECARFLARQNVLPNASAIVFRRSVYEEVGGADPAFRLAGDHLLWARMLLVADVAFVAEPLNRFRRHGGTVRTGAYRDGTLVEEGYRVLAEITAAVPVPPGVLSAACDDLMDRWTELTLLAPTGEVTPERRRRVLELQHAIDPTAGARFRRRLAHRATARFGRLVGRRPSAVGGAA